MDKRNLLWVIGLLATLLVTGCTTTPQGSTTGVDSKRMFEYALVFDGFTPDEMLEMENRVMAFSGYRSHRPVYQGYRRSELWYQSDEPAPDVHRQLAAALTDMGIANLVRLDSEQILVSKITKRTPKPAPVVPSGEGW
ncbi:MAG: hypothetical protein CMK89_14605 [Pseudomonadales bacterium]|nr:hypothetical protein [Pseudomonadales bacterium]RLU01943.1 MAG: hypothetical protein D9N11_11260 [Ketobacter sp.]